MKSVVKPYTATAEILKSGEKITLPQNFIKTQKHLSFTCDIDNIGEGKIVIGHGKDVSSASWVEITKDEVKAFAYYSYTDPKERPLLKEPCKHGFNVFGTLSVVIDVNPLNKGCTLIVACADGMVKLEPVGWDGVYGEIFAQAEGVEVRNCKLNWSTDGFSRKIWIFGDSYLGIGHGARWPYYLYRDGFNHHMLSGYPGMPSQDGIAEFKRCIEFGTPQFAVWTLGMNNMDVDGKINDAYLKATEEFIQICNERGITPILSTIPNVPERDNVPKNAWVRSQPYRYIDFNRAVGADKDVNWYPDMLSADRVHPSTKGAEALYMQVLCDFPEVMQKSNV